MLVRMLLVSSSNRSSSAVLTRHTSESSLQRKLMDTSLGDTPFSLQIFCSLLISCCAFICLLFIVYCWLLVVGCWLLSGIPDSSCELRDSPDSGVCSGVFDMNTPRFVQIRLEAGEQDYQGQVAEQQHYKEAGGIEQNVFWFHVMVLA